MTWLVIFGAVGVASTLAALITLGVMSMGRGHWGMAFTCLACFALVLFLLLAGIEYAETFWEGK